MIEPSLFHKALEENDVKFHTGVPDSLLANYTNYLSKLKKNSHLIAANEGNAIGIAIGHYLSTNKIAAVYMQNSGLGNSINPLISLADNKIYSIPMLLLVGWRGEPGIIDEPQHIKQGEKTLSQLDLLDIPYWLINKNSEYKKIIKTACQTSTAQKKPVALVFHKNAFKYEGEIENYDNKFSLIREEALEIIVNSIGQSLLISTTGKISREIYEIRKKRKESCEDFLTVGGMGHASSIALGVALNTKLNVVCVDGDGSMIMHLGSLTTIASTEIKNFFHILINNESHESVGGQPTAANIIDFKKLCLSVGYKKYSLAKNKKELVKSINDLKKYDGPKILEVQVSKYSRENLGRPKESPEENKAFFIRKVLEKKNK